MKKLFTLVLALCSLSAWAHDFEVDGIYYYILLNGNKVEVTYKGNHFYDYNDEYSGPVTIPSAVTYNGTTYSITSIGNQAFANCYSLTSVTIPNGVTSIGNQAFYNCSGLTSITIPNSVTSIGDETFSGCSSLPIENNLRYADTYLVEAVDKTLSTYSIKKETKWIGSSAFSGCSGLTSMTIPDSVMSIGSSAFAGCSGLTSIAIPNNITSIGYWAFRGCARLTSIVWNAKNCADLGTSDYAPFYAIRSQITSFTFGNEVEYISGALCYGLSELTNVTIPNSVIKIGERAFQDCSSLTSVIIPNSVTRIGSSAFSGCSSLTSVIIPNSVTTIETWAFYKCSSLISITIPNSVTWIGSNAFIDCSTLRSITIPNSLTRIGSYMFKDCSSLTSITIPNSITSIERRAFEGCSGLTSIKLLTEVPPTLGDNVFYNISQSISIYVPCGKVATYMAAEGWNAFSNIQERVAEYSIEIGVNDNKKGTAKVDFNTFCEGNQISATPDYGYYFTQWSDGNTDNPRSLVLTQDTTLIAEFAPNPYTISTSVNYTERGITFGDTTVNYLEYVTISAEANYGYHFTQWSDGNTDNPRIVQVAGDKVYTAHFGKNTYDITTHYNSEQGFVNGVSSAEYLDEAIFTAEATYGYHFTQWSDGITDNPRTLILTQDTTLTAEFAPNQYTIFTESADPEYGTTQGDTTVNYLDRITILATTNYGYHFTQWSDGNTDNPRVVQVTGDNTYIAYFEKNTYNIAAIYNGQMGTVAAPNSAKYLDVATLTATPNYGYHFTQWSDGITDNPRTLVLTQDTTLIAEFAPNPYTISTSVNYTERGITFGDTMVNYLEYVTISAEANYGYHFTQWNDGNTANPRNVQVTEDNTYTASFDKNTYYITTHYNSEQGFVNGVSSAEYLDEAIFTAEATYGYHFTQWSDGNTDNPRSLVLTQDTTLTAEFAKIYSGKCGDSLYWQYAANTINITGYSSMWDDIPWRLFNDSVVTIDIANGATTISDSAFANCKKLNKLSLPASMEEIGANAFTGCRMLYDIYCLATLPPRADASSFTNYNAYLYIPCEAQRYYNVDMVFCQFNNKECISSEEVETDDVIINPGSTDVTITWPTNSDADTYVIVIQQGDKVFCTLTFNKDGQLLKIAFAPGRDGQHRVQYAEMTVKGLRFTVTSLEEGTNYTYDITTKDASGKTISEYSGEFTTKSDVTTSLENTHSQSPMVNSQKLLRNGQLLILRDGKTYNARGAQL